MKAQVLYDLRQLTGYCSGTDLHDFFRQNVGDPSPSGNVEIPDIVVPDNAKQLIRNLASATEAMTAYGVSPEAIAQYAIAWHGGAKAEDRLRVAVERDAKA